MAPTVRWGKVARAAGPVAAALLGFAGLWAFTYWMPFVPKPLGRRLTEGFLRVLLIGYAGVLGLSVAGAVGFGGAVLRARKAGRRRPGAAKGLALCVSCLVGLAGLETAAGLWTAWAHRLPRLPERFPPGPPGEVSVVVVGESSALGYPYDPYVSPGQIVAWRLERALPGKRVVLDNRARLGATLEKMHQGLNGLTRKPDMMIIFSGNNEFLARFDGSRDAGLSESPAGPVLGRLYRASLSSRLCRLVYETANKNRLGGPPAPVRRHEVIDPPLCTPSEYAAVLADFERRLGAIVAYCRAIGAVPVLIVPAANEAGFEPNRTVLADSASPAERAAAAELFARARSAEAFEPDEAVLLYHGLLGRRPEFAEAHFRLGRLLAGAGDWEAAKHHYIQARDRDGFPVRFTTPFQDAYRAVAARSGCILIDGPAVLREVYPHGVLDDHAFHDAHHPSLTSQVALARAVLAALHERRALGLPAGPPAGFSPAEVAAEFRLGPEAWRAVCARAATFYRDSAHARYDPSERLAKQRLYEDAARRIDDGLDPAKTGVPGVGLAGGKIGK